MRLFQISDPKSIARLTFQLDKDYSSISLDDIIGQGAYGSVCKAEYHLPCVAKILHSALIANDVPGNVTRQFERECWFLSQTKHPNIVQALGIAMDPATKRKALLMEVMDSSLTDLLDSPSYVSSYQSQVDICHDLALALDYIHYNKIVHGDVSSSNVLMKGKTAKLSDFGASAFIDEVHLVLVPGNPAYMPPEAFKRIRYDCKLDCFSFGVVTLQVVTGIFPRPGAGQNEREKRRKDIDAVPPDHPLLPIALHCLEDAVTDRPSAAKCCRTLSSLKKEPAYLENFLTTKNLGEQL